MAEEKIYTIPLRRDMLKAPKYQRTKRATSATRNYLIKHCKTENIILGKELNEELHKHGRKNPPTKVKVKVYKLKEKLVANLIDAPMLKEEITKKKGIGEKLKEKVTGKKDKEKKVLEQPKKRKEEITQQIKKKEAIEKEGKKEIFPKDEKPKHEKKK